MLALVDQKVNAQRRRFFALLCTSAPVDDLI